VISTNIAVKGSGGSYVAERFENMGFEVRQVQILEQ
jgi:hypothetical protein